MGSALKQLLDLRDAGDRYDTAPAELLPLQLEAANERLELQRSRIPLLANRAKTAGIAKIAEPADVVPLLFAHNTYKTYSEPWLIEGRWDRMGKWLATVSMFDATDASFEGVDDLDKFVERLAQTGLHVACSSGTTGKPAMLPALEADLEFSAQAGVSSFSWATGIAPARDRRFFGLGPSTNVTRNERIRQAMLDAFQAEDEQPFQLGVPPITVGSIMAMILLRSRITDGSARPGEVAEFERLSEERQAGLDAAFAEAIDELIKSRDRKMLLASMFNTLYPIAVGVRDRGYSGKDFQSDTALFTGGGLKGADLPPDYLPFIFDTFNIDDERFYQLYSMQELNTPFPRCRGGRYHVAPWVMMLPLDQPGERLLDASKGEIEARAAFLDLALDGRWGGVISGDRVNVTLTTCACGRPGPHIGSQIVRYSELEGGDKISCAGTIDAYVRGVA